MPSCVVKSCKNNSNKINKSQGISYHMFPQNKHRKNDWIQVIRKSRGNNNWYPTSYSFVCSAHFDDEDFKTTAKGLRCLIPCAVPKKLIANLPEIENPSSSSLHTILQTSNIREAVKEEATEEIAIKHEDVMEPTVKEEIVEEDAAAINSSFYFTKQEVKGEIEEEEEDEEEIEFNFEEINPRQEHSSSRLQLSSMFQISVVPDKALSGYCRLCSASNCIDRLLNLESDRVMKRLVLNMSNRLNINIDFSQEHLPTSICNACVKSLYMAYDFVVGIDLAQENLNKIAMENYNNEISRRNLGNDLSLYRASVSSTNHGARSDLQQSRLSLSSTTVTQVSTAASTEQPVSLCQPPILQSNSTTRPDTQKKIKMLNQKVRRLKFQNESLKSKLKKITKTFIKDLHARLNDNMVATELIYILNRKKLRKQIKYSRAIKQFCRTLNYYSPQAYDFIRQSFEDCLPHRKTLGKWNGHKKHEHGLTEESFQGLDANAEVDNTDPLAPCSENAN